MRSRWAERLGALVLAALWALPAAAAGPERVLDGFSDPAAWQVVASDQVEGRLQPEGRGDGRALCLAYDFHGVSGYVGLRRALPLALPANYAFDLRLRGSGARNDLQFKLVDASGDNVWWVRRPGFAPPAAWTDLVLRRREVEKAWGPSPQTELDASASIEITLASGEGGKGRLCFDALRLRTLPPRDDSPLTGELRRVGRGGVYDLGRVREFGGVRLQWAPGAAAGDYRVELSADGRRWRRVRQVVASDGGEDALALPDSEARFLRVVPATAAGPALRAVEVQPLAFGASPNAFLQALAQRDPRGTWPRGFSGEQPYWTIVGLDGGREQGLIDEDGAIELGKGGPRVEPFLEVAGRLLTWADVQTTQSLQDGDLPIPSVEWAHADLQLRITTFASGRPGDAWLHARYRVANTGPAPREVALVLALRPLQVNPPRQFLAVQGGVSPLHAVSAGRDRLGGDRWQVWLAQPASAALATSLDRGELVPLLRARLAGPGALAGIAALPRRLHDPQGLASAAVVYRLRLAPGEEREIDWRSRLEGPVPARPPAGPGAAQLQAEVAAAWRARLDRVGFAVPPEARKLVATLRTALAHILISRSGPRLQPGTRSYARAWIRDGAMIDDALLRLGHARVAEDFVRWFAPYQFASGKVPCCVDERGSDPVPENDSHGQLIHAIAEVYRYTGDRAFLAAMWPHVQGAVAYMEQLRLSERTEANRARDPAFYGLMPASISHEGYSAKPMHSYWDDAWALRGYKDAVQIARWLGHADAAARYAAARDEFRADVLASLRLAMARHGIDYLPGAAELGDFDATSSTAWLAPGGEQAGLPRDALAATFERYWAQFVARRDGTRAWKDYTPYELRTVGSMVRLGWRERALQALAFFLRDQQPPGWNQWAEVVSATPRVPFFLGDLPHAWVESDYIRAALDLFAYPREHDDALVLGAGLPAQWLQGEGVAVRDLRTPQGDLSYRLRAQGGVLQVEIAAGLRVPRGGLVLAPPAPWANGQVEGGPPLVGGELRIDRLPARLAILPAAAD